MMTASASFSSAIRIPNRAIPAGAAASSFPRRNEAGGKTRYAARQPGCLLQGRNDASEHCLSNTLEVNLFRDRRVVHLNPEVVNKHRSGTPARMIAML
jgi:hypothetical protein